MVKTIGIITRHCYPNYGSILQTFALQSAIEMIGAKPVVLDYVSKDDTAIGLVKANLRISKKSRSLPGYILYILVQTPTFMSMYYAFRWHQKRLLKLSATVSDREGLSHVTDTLDCVVAGSDQIWNRIIDSIDTNYFLPFVRHRFQRLSYAASLGSASPRIEDTDVFLSGVRGMGTVSVRESSSAKWISEQGVEARDDVDPVLLHRRQFWEEFADDRKNDFKYMLVYQLHRSDSFERRLKEAQSKLRLPVIRVSPDWKNILLPGSTKVLVSPEVFLAWIRDAACVVTDSFHGTSFALKFGRPLYVIPPGRNATRLTDVMSRFGLEHLVVGSESDQPLPDAPDYDSEKIERLLIEQAASSWKYLNDAIAGDQK